MNVLYVFFFVLTDCSAPVFMHDRYRWCSAELRETEKSEFRAGIVEVI